MSAEHYLSKRAVTGARRTWLQMNLIDTAVVSHAKFFTGKAFNFSEVFQIRRGGGGGPSKRHLGPAPHIGGVDDRSCLDLGLGSQFPLREIQSPLTPNYSKITISHPGAVLKNAEKLLTITKKCNLLVVFRYFCFFFFWSRGWATLIFE